jgi:hypothetical protein
MWSAQFAKDRKSQVFVAVLIIMVLVFSLGAGLLFHSRTFREVSNLEVSIKKAQSQARSGIGITDTLIAQSTCGSLPANQSYNLGDGTIEIEVDEATQTVTSTGLSGKSIHVIKKIVDISDGVGWDYRRKITIHSLDTHLVNTDQSDFPVLVIMTLDNAHVSQSDGGDIRFMNSAEDTQLDHEIENYDSATGNLIAWVKIPILTSVADTIVYVYYGNDDAGLPDQWNAPGVWDSNFVAVWHLDEATKTTRFDSTSYGNDLTDDYGIGVIGVSGKIGGAGYWNDDPEDVYLWRADSVGSSLDILGSITLEAWVNMENTDDTLTVFGKWRGGAPEPPYQFRIEESSGRYRTNWHVSDGGSSYSSNHSDYDDMPNYGTFYYVVVIYDYGADELRSYVNGSESGSTGSHSTGLFDSDGDFFLGARYKHTNFDGIIDEARITDTVRSDDWIKTSYENQNDVSNFMIFDAEESCI